MEESEVALYGWWVVFCVWRVFNGNEELKDGE